ncbi:soma ferritin [Biomphalaria pfeifferi]|uniref:Soma ferritin n=1 Tax=Biomphalaria pfeifferi TaxID=112525 RepID=A0AAD8BZQ7_BIOPF|nr:soma ferritin [Biomphalaria pfeifferi]
MKYQKNEEVASSFRRSKSLIETHGALGLRRCSLPFNWRKTSTRHCWTFTNSAAQIKTCRWRIF